MSGNLGLWIDHGKAFLVELNGKGEVRRKLVSEVEPHTRYHSGSKSPRAAAESTAEHRRANQLKIWYKEVITAVGDTGAERIFILGPGEAKTELMAELDKNKAMAKRVVGMESVDQLTENQIAAMVRNYFDPAGGEKVPAYRKAPGS